ncbi:MAG TPA: zinc ribbon domain-containing protein [Candidatus Atribacteria bacterium]|nr:zinc ribbon domain-containing protein [Candidatus Atribacteria bacterium]
MDLWGYLLIAGLLVFFASLRGVKRRGSSVSVSEFWQEKEKEFGEKKILSGFSRYLGGHPRFEAISDGLLFLMSRSLWFENFEKGPSIFGIAPPFKKVIFRILLSQIEDVESLPEKELLKRGFDSRQLWKYHRLSRRPFYLAVKYRDEWEKEKTLYFDSMIDADIWREELEKAKSNYVPEEGIKESGVCPQCGKKIDPDFKLCPYCGCGLS